MSLYVFSTPSSGTPRYSSEQSGSGYRVQGRSELGIRRTGRVVALENPCWRILATGSLTGNHYAFMWANVKPLVYFACFVLMGGEIR